MDIRQIERTRCTVNFFVDRWAVDPATGQPDPDRHLGQMAVHNLVVDAGLNLLRDFLGGVAVTGLNYFAIADGAGAPAAGTTILPSERYRDVFTQKTSTAKTLTIKYYLGSLQGNGFTYTWAGLFGNGATAAANSGTLFAAVSFAGMAKTTAEAWTFSWVVTIADDGV